MNAIVPSLLRLHVTAAHSGSLSDAVRRADAVAPQGVAHPPSGAETAPDREWLIAWNPVYRVNTTRNPSETRRNVAWGELIDAGEMVDSRVYATGFPVAIDHVHSSSCNDAHKVMRRYKAHGAARFSRTRSRAPYGGGEFCSTAEYSTRVEKPRREICLCIGWAPQDGKSPSVCRVDHSTELGN